MVDAACNIVNEYIQAVSDVVSASDKPLTDAQSISIIANIMYAAEDLLPRLEGMFFKKAPMQVNKLIDVQEKTKSTFEQFSQAFGSQRGRAIVQNLKWSKADYSHTAITGSPEPSSAVVPVLKYLISLHEDSAKLLGENNGTGIISVTISSAFTLMADERGWKRYQKGGSTSGTGGLQKLLLDIHCMAQVGILLMKQSQIKIDNEVELVENLQVGLSAIKKRASEIFQEHGGNILS